MPSPFPGMDPFLENPNTFPDLHQSLIVFLKQVLQERLPRPYYATSGTRIVVEGTERSVEPDVDVFHPRKPRKVQQTQPASLAERSVPVVVEIPEDAQRQGFLNIFVRKDRHDRLVGSIEVLSPTNKASGHHGRGEYLRKQEEMLGSKTHLVEIDLLRGGLPTTAVPRYDAIAKAGPFDYHVCVRRFDTPGKYLVYPILLRQRLPVIDIPLLPGDPPVPVDLQAVFDQAYQAGGYERWIDYANETPTPPFTAKQATWASRLLRQKGLLPRKRRK